MDETRLGLVDSAGDEIMVGGWTSSSRACHASVQVNLLLS